MTRIIFRDVERSVRLDQSCHFIVGMFQLLDHCSGFNEAVNRSNTKTFRLWKCWVRQVDRNTPYYSHQQVLKLFLEQAMKAQRGVEI